MSVYFVQAGDTSGPIKIGVAKHPHKRIVELQTGCPLPLSMLFVFPVAEESHTLESALHYLFRDLTIGNLEWHRFSPRIVEAMDVLRDFHLRLVEAHGDDIQIDVRRFPDEIAIHDVHGSQIPVRLRAAP